MLVDKNEQIRALRRKYGRKLKKDDEEIVEEESDENEEQKNEKE